MKATCTGRLALLGGAAARTRPFTRWPHIGPDERRAVNEVLDRMEGRSDAAGEAMCSSFERELAELHGVREAITTSSGTAALMLALKAVGVGAGDEVIVPAISYVATATAASLLGAIPVFVDVDRVTHGVVPEAIAAAIGPRTRAIVIVHLHGYPCDLEAIAQIARRAALPLVEDCAQAHGARDRGRRVGTVGNLAAFSFATMKNLSAGEGGAVITDDPALAREVRSLKDHGRPPGVKDDHLRLGWGCRMSELQGALLRAQLARLDAQVAVKMQAAAYLAERVASLQVPWLKPPALPEKDSVHGLFCFALHYDPRATGVSPAVFARAVTAEGVPCGDRATLALPDVHLYSQGECAGARRVTELGSAREVARTLIRMGQPTGSGFLLDSFRDLDDIVTALRKVSDGIHHLAKRTE